MNDSRKRTYDYIIVGSGAAGSVLAKRLGEDGVRVLVLEAGPDDRSVYVRMPAAMSYPLTDRKRTYVFETGPEPALDDRVITHIRGRMLGGSGSLNGMVFVRGNWRDYDRWQELGNAGWSYADCLPYFKKLERFDGGANAYRGGEGPIAITTLDADMPVYHAFLEAGQQAGHALNPDYNAHHQEGVHVYQANIDNGIRASGGLKYLRPATRKGNVELLLNALARRVVIEGRRAVGVEFERNGETLIAHAEREVILAGGSFNSPQLLMLSGIGPAPELAKHGIASVADVAGVGVGLTDHPAVSVQYRARQPGLSPIVKVSLLKMALIGAEWLLLRRGLGVTNMWEVGSFIKSSEDVDYANIQHEFLPMLGELMHGKVEIQEGFQYQVCHMRPRSRGRVTLKSADPAVHPAIVNNYLSDPEDRRDFLNGVRRTDEIVQMKGWDALRGEPVVPGLRKMKDAELFAWVKQHMGTQYHPSSTCRMGNDDMSVVDTAGRVHEVEGLRVVDASIMPTITSGNLHAPVMMLAEKLADTIRGRTPLPPEQVVKG